MSKLAAVHHSMGLCNCRRCRERAEGQRWKKGVNFFRKTIIPVLRRRHS